MPTEYRGRSSPVFRRVFEVTGQFDKAELYICGLGYHEAYLNGQRVGDHVLNPAQTDFEQRCFYVCHDVTALIRSGGNAIGVTLGDGFFNQDIVWTRGRHAGARPMSYGEPRVIAALVIHNTGGTSTAVKTDTDWRCHAGPITFNNVYAGEHYDATLEQPGWDETGFDETYWVKVYRVAPTGGKWEPQTIPPIRKTQALRPVAIQEHDAGVFTVDMGQNFSGWARIRVQAPVGTVIRLRYAETLFPDGRINTASTGVFATTVEQVDQYTCKGVGIETWEPRFTYHGFRYVEVVGWPGKPMVDDITGIVVHTDLPAAGRFECSDDRLNTLHNMALWTFRGNMHGIPTDCPAREKCGWLGDAHVTCSAIIHNFNAQSFWEKFLGDIETARANNNGLPTNIAPGKRNAGTARCDWMAAAVLIPWDLYVYYGNRDAIERHWPMMQRVFEYFCEQSDGGLLKNGYGDWCDPLNSTRPTYTSPELTTTIWFHETGRIMAEAARALGDTQSSERFAEWLPKIRRALHEHFFDSNLGTFGSQTANAMALQYGLVPEGQHGRVVDSLVRDIRETHNTHQSVGIMGLRTLFEVLTRNGHGQVALDLFHQDTFPSFGDLIVNHGATTLWEYWGEPEVDAADGPRSLSHPMMGGFDNFFYNTLAGIRPDPTHPGFAHFVLEPHPIEGIEWVKAHHDSPHGRIASDWRIEGNRFVWNVTVPPGTRATATLPWSGRKMELSPAENREMVDQR